MFYIICFSAIVSKLGIYLIIQSLFEYLKYAAYASVYLVLPHLYFDDSVYSTDMFENKIEFPSEILLDLGTSY